MSDGDGSNNNKWLIPVMIVVGIILLGIVVLIILIVLNNEGVDSDCTKSSDCKEGLVCTQSGKCKKKNGQNCEFDDQCASGECSISSGFICVSPTGSSSNCAATGAAPCKSGEICDISKGVNNARCVSTLGNPCILNNDCIQPAVCVPVIPSPTGPPTSFVCLGTTGAVCTTDSDCLSGTCNTNGGTTGTCSGVSSSTSLQDRNSRTQLGTTLLPGISMAPTPGVSFRNTFRDNLGTTPVNQTFCLESGLSRTERAINPDTPSPQEVENPFQKIRKDMMMSRGDTKQSPVIDVTNYSNATLALTQDGRIITEKGNRNKKKIRELVANNVKLIRLESFNGTLYGVSVDGRVFALNNDTFNTRKWHWNVAPFITGVVHTSVTLDGKHFWVQTPDTGILYDRNLNIVKRSTKPNRKRVFGENKDLYIDIDLSNNTAVLHPNGTKIENVASAVIDHEDRVKILKPSQTSLFSDIRLVNWKPTFIRKFLEK